MCLHKKPFLNSITHVWSYSA